MNEEESEIYDGTRRTAKYETKQDVHKPLSPLVQITSQVIGTTPCSHIHLCTYYHPATILLKPWDTDNLTGDRHNTMT